MHKLITLATVLAFAALPALAGNQSITGGTAETVDRSWAGGNGDFEVVTLGSGATSVLLEMDIGGGYRSVAVRTDRGGQADCDHSAAGQFCTFVAPRGARLRVTVTGGTAETTIAITGADEAAAPPTTDAADLTAGTIAAARVGADHIDAITEIASGLKSGDDTTLITGTAGAASECVQWDAAGNVVTSGSVCGGSGCSHIDCSTDDAILEPGATGTFIVRQPSGVAGTDEVQISNDGTKTIIDSKSGDLLVRRVGSQRVNIGQYFLDLGPVGELLKISLAGGNRPCNNIPLISTTSATTTGFTIDGFLPKLCHAGVAEVWADANGLHVYDGDAIHFPESAATPTGTQSAAYFDTDTDKINVHDGAAWNELQDTSQIGAAPPATCTAGTFWIDTDETDDTNCTTTADNSLCLCVATDTWVALENN